MGYKHYKEFRTHYWKNGKNYHVRLHEIWLGMLKRCNAIKASPLHYKSHPRDYKAYFLNGITVCDEWRKSYGAFWHWAVTHGYRHNLTIDRIDRKKGYCPENCQWITKSENSRKANYYRWHVKPYEVA